MKLKHSRFSHVPSFNTDISLRGRRHLRRRMRFQRRHSDREVSSYPFALETGDRVLRARQWYRRLYLVEDVIVFSDADGVQE